MGHDHYVDCDSVVVLGHERGAPGGMAVDRDYVPRGSLVGWSVGLVDYEEGRGPAATLPATKVGGIATRRQSVSRNKKGFVCQFASVLASAEVAYPLVGRARPFPCGDALGGSTSYVFGDLGVVTVWDRGDILGMELEL
jgi:hypothetical protein